MIEIVPFALHHQQGVLEVILPIQREEFGIPVTLDDPPDLLDIPGFYRRGAGNFWVAVSKLQVIGTISLLDIGAERAALRKMFVRTAFRGTGVAQRLLATLLASCAEGGCREVFLGTTVKYLAAHLPPPSVT